MGLLSPLRAYGLGVAAAAEAVCFSSIFLSQATVPRSCGTGIISRKTKSTTDVSRVETPQRAKESKAGANSPEM